MSTKVRYDGTDYGKIYLGDVGQRNQLGTGRGIYSYGQDRYLSHGQDATFIDTGDVLLSANRGRIAKLNRDTTANHFRAFKVT